MNKSLCRKPVTSAVLHDTRFFPTATDHQLEPGKAWEQGCLPLDPQSQAKKDLLPRCWLPETVAVKPLLITTFSTADTSLNQRKLAVQIDFPLCVVLNNSLQCRTCIFSKNPSQLYTSNTYLSSKMPSH